MKSISNKKMSHIATIVKEPTMKANIDFIESDLAKVIQDQQHALHNKPKEVFKSKKQVFRRKMLDQQQPYSVRDIHNELMMLDIQEKSIDVSHEILKLYLKKSALWVICIASCTVFLEFINLGTSRWFDINIATQVLLIIASAICLLSFGALDILNRFKIKNLRKYDAKIRCSQQPLLDHALTSLASKFDAAVPEIILTVKPQIFLQEKQKKQVLYLGIPLLHALTNQELYALTAYHFEYHRILKQQSLLRFFNGRSKTPFRHSKKTGGLKLEMILGFTEYHLHRKVAQESVISGIEAVSFSSLCSALDKNHRLELAFDGCIQAAKAKEMVPINIITQIVCASENRDIIYQVECEHLKDNLKAMIGDQIDSLALIHKLSPINQEYQSHWLIQDLNAKANEISKNLLLKFGFTEPQLEKTHNAHQVFPLITEVDPIQFYYGGLYRTNRTIAPNLIDGDAGSLLSLKAELNILNAEIRKKSEKSRKLLQNWDLYLLPHHLKTHGTIDERQHLERLHLDLINIEALLAKKSGLSLAITLTMASPQEQKALYEVLDAHRKCSNLHRAIEDLLQTRLEFNNQASSQSIMQLRKALQTLAGLCQFLPRTGEQCTSVLVIELAELLIEQGRDLQAAELENMASDLVSAIDRYRWNTEKQLVSACQKVEDRLGIN